MAAPDYLSGTDAEFDHWQDNFVNYANAHIVALGLSAADLVRIAGAQAFWKTGYSEHLAAEAAALSARMAKDYARGAYEVTMRLVVRRLQASPQVNDRERAALGITVPRQQPQPLVSRRSPPRANGFSPP